uniref:Uncharacterized protein n=1 Tax=Sphaerodactylus townsendi TaxID=933632 RepID=A0ACB8EBE6_9SAUR
MCMAAEAFLELFHTCELWFTLVAWLVQANLPLRHDKQECIFLFRRGGTDKLVKASGVVRQVKPIVGPFYATLKLEMNYVVGGVVSHRNIVNVHIFVSEYWF